MREPIFCGQISLAPLLPKLRGHFAEFLNNASPAGLRILSSSTCVGLRYGYDTNNSSFSWYNIQWLPYSISVLITHLYYLADLPTKLLMCLNQSFLSWLHLLSYVTTVLLYRSTGISTCCPSTTDLSLALGPDLPGADQLYPGNLRYSACRILTYISLLIPAFSLQ